MKLTLSTCPCLLGALSTLVPLVAAVSVQAQSTVRLPQYGIAFETPRGYRIPSASEIPATVRAVYMAKGPIVNKFGSTLNLNVQNVAYSTLPSNFESQVAASMQKDLAPSTSSAKILSTKRGTVAGVPALEVVMAYQMKTSPTPIRTSQVFFVRDKQLFTLGFSTEATSFTNQYPVFGTFLRTVQWLPMVKIAHPPSR